MSNAEEIVAELRSKGVTCFLDKTNTFRARAKKGVLTDFEKVGIDICRRSLTEVLRREKRLCIRCGTAPATRPSYTGYLGRKGTPAGNIQVSSWRLKARYGCSWCEKCWQQPLSALVKG